MGITIEKPFFYVQSHKIYSLFDAPHLLKCVRNYFKKYKAKFVHKTVLRMASWDHVVTAYNIDSKLQHHMVPKLTRRHVEVDGLSSMNVRLAAQVFSHSVAAILNLISFMGALPNDANDTADFCNFFNDVFDRVNSKVFKHSERPLLSAVSKTSNHLECWKEYSEVIQSSFFSGQKK